MLQPRFLLTQKLPLTLYRRSLGSYVDGEWVEGTTTEVDIEANIQPLKDHELMMLPESERSREWVKVYSASMIRTQREGFTGYGVGYGEVNYDADEFVWQGMRFKVMKVRGYFMGILNHFRAYAARIELTPN